LAYQNRAGVTNQDKEAALEDKYAYLGSVLEEIALTHPEYGYRWLVHELN